MVMLTKKECIKILKKARYIIQPYTYVSEALDFAIKELSNPPLKFEELKEGMWVWVEDTKQYAQVERTYTSGIDIVEMVVICGYHLRFKENCFYRKQVE